MGAEGHAAGAGQGSRGQQSANELWRRACTLYSGLVFLRRVCGEFISLSLAEGVNNGWCLRPVHEVSVTQRLSFSREVKMVLSVCQAAPAMVVCESSVCPLSMYDSLNITINMSHVK